MASDPLSPSEHRAPGAPRLLTAAEVAALLGGVPKTWVYEQSRLGRIPTVTLGRYKHYRRSAIEEWLAQLEAPARRLAS
jgi:predicted DNA-binding transcriptional regulator AlpA